MMSFYLTVSIVILFIAYAGIEETMRLFRYFDLQFRYVIIKVRIGFMRRKLKKQLMVSREKFLIERKE
jgi:hypothetical protein|tara:strand:- start:4150 stop:4353 length:204 start_codon:yes stop_codon:yes gene_type:complete